MNSKKKLITLITSVALIAAIGVGATLAYLTQKTDTVTNTFTIGSYETQALSLFEHKVAKNADTGDYTMTRETTTTGNTYTAILPGTTLYKDPAMTLAQGSPSSFLVIKATGLNQLPAGVSVADLDSNHWLEITVAGASANDTYYIYCPAGNGQAGYLTATELSGAAVTTAPLFTQLSVASSFNGASIGNLVFEGCAVQYGSDMGTNYVASVVSALPADFIA